MKALLINREWNVAGSWYEPCRKLEQFKSVINADYYCTSSSAGDWDGLMFQRLNNRIYAIPFSQVNNCPRGGFTLYTGDVVAKLVGESCDFEAVTAALMESLID